MKNTSFSKETLKKHSNSRTCKYVNPMIVKMKNKENGQKNKEDSEQQQSQ
jgi:hypothetical protein